MNTNVRAKKGFFNRTDTIDWDQVVRSDFPKVFNYFRYSGLDDDSADELASTIFEKLRKLLFQLPDRERELVALKYGTGMTNRGDIAELTGLTESNIGTILHRVVTFLRKSLEVNNE